MASMTYQQPDNTSSTSFNTSTVQGPPHGFPRRRTDTSSSTSSGTVPVPIPPGYYTLPAIHGTCPRCHHYHKAASINVRVSLDPTRISYVRCEKCKEKWFAFGASNSTRISLLSTRTTEPDIVEQSFRYALIDVVRSVTSVASASALASVPEKPSRVPSRQQSLHSGPKDHQGDHQESPYATLSPSGREVPAIPIENPPQDAHRRDPDLLRHLERSLSIFDQIRSRIKEKLSLLRTSRLRKIILPKQQTKSTTKTQGKMPVVEAAIKETTISQNPDLEPEIQHDAQGTTIAPIAASAGPLESKTAPRIVLRWGDVDKAEIRGMSREKRISWFREQITKFKAQHDFDHSRRRKSTTTSALGTEDFEPHLPPPPPSPQSPPQRPIRRRHSDDLLLIGSHLQVFQPGEFFHTAHPISLGSTARFSQTGTAVNSDSLTATSGVPYLDMGPNQQAQIPRASQPASFPSDPAYLHPAMGGHDFQGGRLSVDSLNLNGVGRGATDQRSMASIPSISLTGETAHSNAYTTGYRTSEEHSQNRRST